VSAILNSTPPVLEAWDPHAIDDVYPGRGYAGWTSGDFVRHYDVVQEALGIVTGVVHRKLETASEYRVAADIILCRCCRKKDIWGKLCPQVNWPLSANVSSYSFNG